LQRLRFPERERSRHEHLAELREHLRQRRGETGDPRAGKRSLRIFRTTRSPLDPIELASTQWYG
jgi:hypothetical protein